MPDRYASTQGPRRRRGAWLLATCFASGLALGLWPSGRVALACSCRPPDPPAQSLEAADAVFRGSVRALERTERGGPIGVLQGVVAHIEISTTWKGDLGSEVAVHTADNTAACGFPFHLGQDVIVYATLDEESQALRTHICTRSRRYDAQEAAALDAAAPPAPTATPDPAATPRPTPPPVQCPACPRPVPDQQAVERHDAAFRARVVSAEELGPQAGWDRLVGLSVVQVWKGDVHQRELLHVPYEVWHCGPTMARLGDEWLLFVDEAPEGSLARYMLPMCTPTMPFDAAIAAGLGDACEPPRVEVQPEELILGGQDDSATLQLLHFGIAPMTVTLRSDPPGVVETVTCLVPEDAQQCREIEVRALVEEGEARLMVHTEGRRCQCVAGRCGPGPGSARSEAITVRVAGEGRPTPTVLPTATVGSTPTASPTATSLPTATVGSTPVATPTTAPAPAYIPYARR